MNARRDRADGPRTEADPGRCLGGVAGLALDRTLATLNVPTHHRHLDRDATAALARLLALGLAGVAACRVAAASEGSSSRAAAGTVSPGVVA